MEEEIDLRPYLEALLKRWYWIIGVALVSGLVAFVVSLSLPPTYEATALIVVTSPQQVVLYSLTQDTLDPTFDTVDETIPLLRAYPELATSDEIMRQLIAKLDLPAAEVKGLEDLRELLTAEAGTDPSLMRLTVQYKDAQTAARIANTWAALFVPWVNDNYIVTNDVKLRFFETQLVDVRAQLETAESELVTYQATNRTVVLQSSLDALTIALEDLLEEQRTLAYLLRDAQLLEAQLTAQAANIDVPLAYQLTALNLQLHTYSAEILTGVQLQLAPGTALTGTNRNEQLNFLASLLSSLEERQTQIEEELADIEPQILALQQQKQVAVIEEQRLLRARQEAQETYTALTRSVDAERISTADTSGGVSLASNSAVPEEPISPRVLINVIVVVLFSMLLCIGLIMVRTFQDT